MTNYAPDFEAILAWLRAHPGADVQIGFADGRYQVTVNWEGHGIPWAKSASLGTALLKVVRQLPKGVG